MSLFEEVSAYDDSLASTSIARLLDAVGESRTREIVEEFLAGQSVVELAAQEHDFAGTWARSKQVPPDTDWESWGHLMGRGTGKTLGISKYVNQEAESGRAPLICLAAQDEDNTIKLQVTGPSGLLATARPDFKPIWHVTDKVVTWPNGAIAYVRTPEVPGKIRGLEYMLAWICELQSWPNVTRDEAYMNVLVSTRLGYGRIVWDATPKRRHPLLRKLLETAKSDPKKNIVIRGSTHENRLNLGAGYIAKLEKAIGGTQQGAEELHGEMSLDASGATAKDEWIERNRRTTAGRLLRRVIAVDPAVTARSGSDNTGIVDVGLSIDGKALLLGDHTGKHEPEVWSAKVLDLYVDGGCDLVIVETNKGGNLLVANLRAAALGRELEILVIGKEERAPGHRRGVVHVREVYGKGEKADRAKPLSTAYEKDLVCHVGTFVELEETVTTWEPTPGARSPDRLDPLVYGVSEVLGLAVNTTDPKKAFEGIEALSAAVQAPHPNEGRSLSALLGNGSGSDTGI